MTICIAAICAENKVVAVTDKMLTVTAPVTTRYEISENNKAIPLKKDVVALFAGDVVAANQVLSIAKGRVKEENSVQEVADILNQSFKDYWDKILSNYLMMRYKIDLHTFMHNQQSFDQVFVRNTTDLISKFSINVEMIVAGKDSQGAHLFSIDNAGTVINRDSQGYLPIGSGSQHATFSLIESGFNTHFSPGEALYALLQAKKRAEYDPGVGNLTDIITVNDEVKIFKPDEVDAVTKLFHSSAKEVARIDKKYVKKLEKMII